MIRAIIFDCFGVLVGKGFEYTYRLAGGDPGADREFIESTLGQANMGLISDEDFRDAMASKLGINLEKWQQAVREADTPDEELLDYIKSLRPKYKTAILSNANKGVIERKIGEQRLKGCFDLIVVSADEGIVKPDERIYKLTAERLGVKLDECIFIDDSQYFVEASRALGMKDILYVDFQSLKDQISKLTA